MHELADHSAPTSNEKDDLIHQLFFFAGGLGRTVGEEQSKRQQAAVVGWVRKEDEIPAPAFRQKAGRSSRTSWADA